MNNLIVIGAGGHGKSVAEVVHLQKKLNIIGFLDDSYPEKSHVGDYPILGNTKDLSMYRPLADHVIIAVGNNVLREKLLYSALNNGFQIATIIHPSAIISSQSQIGRGVTIMAGSIIGTDVVIGDGVIINSGTIVDHDCHLLDFCHLGIGVNVAGGAKIGRTAWIKAGSSLGYNVRIEDFAVVDVGTSLI